MSEIVLTADTTRQTGTRPSKRLRREQRVPAVVYGLSQDAVSIDVAWVDLREALTTDAGVNAVIHLKIGGEKQMSIVKDIQRHPVRRDVTHVDFLRIDPDQDVNVDVPLVMIGEAKAVTDADGMVDQNLFSLTVNAAPDSIPNELEVDISALDNRGLAEGFRHRPPDGCHHRRGSRRDGCHRHDHPVHPRGNGRRGSSRVGGRGSSSWRVPIDGDSDGDSDGDTGDTRQLRRLLAVRADPCCGGPEPNEPGNRRPGWSSAWAIRVRTTRGPATTWVPRSQQRWRTGTVARCEGPGSWPCPARFVSVASASPWHSRRPS